MSAQELADRLGMPRSRMYAVLAGADNATGPLTIHYRTAAGGVGEAPVAWTVEPLRGTRRIRVTREEIRYPADRTAGHGGGTCLLYTSPSPRDRTRSRMPSSA